MAINPLGMNQGTQNFIRFEDDGGTINTQIIDVRQGTITRVSTLGTIEFGTISSLPNIPGGTVGVVTSVTNLAGGTVTRVEQGSINVTSGTVTTGSIIVTLGTVVGVDAEGAGTTQHPVLIAGRSGTAVKALITDASNRLVVVMQLGTVNAGTFRDDGRPSRNILSYGTTFGGTAAGYATLVGSAVVGAGTSLWVQDVSVNNPNGNITCMVGFGTALNGSSVLLKGVFGTTSGVGQEKTYAMAVNAGMTNQDIVAYISGAGTIDVNISYFISA